MSGINSLSGLNNVNVDFRPTIEPDVPKTANANQPQQAIDFGLDPDLVWDGYDFADAAHNTAQYVEEVMKALNGGDDRFKVE